ncbi:MAG: hypothetical protein ACREXS_11205, partial [Gammaproteobacteria bacterium]
CQPAARPARAEVARQVPSPPPQAGCQPRTKEGAHRGKGQWEGAVRGWHPAWQGGLGTRRAGCLEVRQLSGPRRGRGVHIHRKPGAGRHPAGAGRSFVAWSSRGQLVECCYTIV